MNIFFPLFLIFESNYQFSQHLSFKPIILLNQLRATFRILFIHQCTQSIILIARQKHLIQSSEVSKPENKPKHQENQKNYYCIEQYYSCYNNQVLEDIVFYSYRVSIHQLYSARWIEVSTKRQLSVYSSLYAMCNPSK